MDSEHRTEEAAKMKYLKSIFEIHLLWIVECLSWRRKTPYLQWVSLKDSKGLLFEATSIPILESYEVQARVGNENLQEFKTKALIDFFSDSFDVE